MYEFDDRDAKQRYARDGMIHTALMPVHEIECEFYEQQLARAPISKSSLARPQTPSFPSC